VARKNRPPSTMPSPVLIIGGVVIAVGAGFAFKQFVYDPYLSEKVHLWVEDFAEQRRMRGRRLADPHEASPSSRGNSSPRSSFDEKRSLSRGSVANAGISTGTEMRPVPFISTSLRHRGAPSHQHNNSELEMATMGELSPLDSLDTPTAAWQSEAARLQNPFSAPAANTGLPTPPATQATPITSPRSPFSGLRALSEISFGAPSSSDPFEEYQNFSPPPAAALSPPAVTGPALFSPFVVPNAPPPDPFVDVPSPADARSPPPDIRSPFVDVPRTISERPTSPWSELSAHSAATAGQGQLHLRLSRTDTDSEKEGSEAGSDGSWEHT